MRSGRSRGRITELDELGDPGERLTGPEVIELLETLEVAGRRALRRRRGAS